MKSPPCSISAMCRRRVVVALAFAGARPRRPAEDPEERVGELAVRQLHRARPRGKPWNFSGTPVASQTASSSASARSARGTEREKYFTSSALVALVLPG